MTDFKVFARCDACKRNRFFIRKRKIQLPIGPVATSQKLMCNGCYSMTCAMLNHKNK